jgi:threonine/homoserine/homoserine lactone efflux protein
MTQTVLRWVGTVYLLYLGCKLLRSQLTQGREKAEPVSVLQAVLFQFLNPKAWIMSITAATVFLPRELSPLAANAYMVSTEILIGLPCIAAWALFGTALRSWLARPAAGSAFNAVMALSLATTAVIMVL